MKRRDAIWLLLTLGVTPFSSFAQQKGKVWHIGYLSPGSGSNEFDEAFRDQLRGLGYIEGRNLSIEYRWAGKADRQTELAAELVQLKVDVIVTPTTFGATMAKRATSTIPIVMVASDPVGASVITSLARPGGNVTGMSIQSTDLSAKRVQLLREILPGATRVAALFSRSGAGSSTLVVLDQIRTAAQQMGITVVEQSVSEAEALAGAFAAMQRERAQALIVQLSPFTNDHRKRIVELAAKHRLPALFESRAFVDVGGLMSYGPNLPEIFRRAAFYVDRIFKGAKPADLPVEQPTKFEMVINMKTAKTLGLTIPQSILIRADEVIK
ncbi:MAG: ABC transporter substrate-binding protein [Betaproteobacteria bacterium]|nr:ABC transporter substrate-binding protein [Betaproteobacteria bacterium]